MTVQSPSQSRWGVVAGEDFSQRCVSGAPLVDEEAGDPPIWRVFGGPAVGASELDPWQLVGGTELAPADAQVAIEDEDQSESMGPESMCRGQKPWARR
jgi:hypothetical protein